MELNTKITTRNGPTQEEEVVEEGGGTEPSATYSNGDKQGANAVRERGRNEVQVVSCSRSEWGTTERRPTRVIFGRARGGMQWKEGRGTNPLERNGKKVLVLPEHRSLPNYQ